VRPSRLPSILCPSVVLQRLVGEVLVGIALEVVLVDNTGLEEVRIAVVDNPGVDRSFGVGIDADCNNLGSPLRQLLLYVRYAYVYGRKVFMGFRKGACVKLHVDVLGDAWSG
jgi:hypothetical protein